MKKHFLYFAVLCLAVGTTDAQAATKKKTKAYLKLVSAYSTATEIMPMATGTHFVVIWEGAKYPETFFWRGNNGWLACNMDKAHKGSKKPHSNDLDYTTEAIDNNNVHKGDTLMLSPTTGGKFPIPAEIPKTAKNTLFFTTAGSTWLSFPVKKISKRS